MNLRRTSGLFVVPLLACTPSLYSEGGAVGEWVAPVNTWPTAEPPAELDGEGFSAGQVAPDFLLNDQFGDDVALWQFYGNVVLFDVSTIWCAPCQELAMDTEDTWEEYRDEGFVYVTILQQNLEGGEPTLEDLNEWAEGFGITAPIVSDPQGTFTGGAIRNDQFPAVLVLDRDMTVAERVNPINDHEVRAAIERALGR